jgi:putative phosphoribosyl transferase
MFRDRIEVGKLLARRISALKVSNPIVLAIPRGGVPVAKEIALALHVPLDLVITRKIGAPGQPEFAIGAVTQDGNAIVDEETVNMFGISREYIQEERTRQMHEIQERMRKYRGSKPYPNLEGKTVVIVDDGIATGNTMIAAIESLRRQKPSSIIIATGVAPKETVAKLSKVADRVICLDSPEPFYAIGQFYENFDQVEDEEVVQTLSEVDRHLSLDLLKT